ncbi:tRNA pseudouridine(38-40) synthase TruA [Deinococcus multiflagellatus]|uniref:tRNA pseudouridine(38-40) synthase TruA n=1 Tax=Deinococcus multiflagellatus TaxID=1656887 RepID=UPI001CCCC813|nr:tRNA pseudouridine(38-40) synthase TruA [Deinococcus multiflagellatus]MBZ9714827.1 tRNA pseudouridine(38-40) synthase TruA [Deinococcus multiflagellatus]
MTRPPAPPPPAFRPPDGHRRLRLTVAWDGAPFAGWQAQANAPSVQDTLHAAFARLGADRFRPVAAGRTDAGVHAEAMPVHVDVPGTFRVPPERLARALNAWLPPTVAVLDAQPAPFGFHARFSCLERRYVYRLWCAPQRHPLWAGRALHVPPALDVAAMNAAAQALTGTHDFAAFATQEDRQTVRELRHLTVVPGAAADGAGLWAIHVHGESFLRHMVRGLVGTLLLVGQGKLDPAGVQGILHSRQRAQAGANVAASGLYFAGALYPGDPASTTIRSSR